MKKYIALYLAPVSAMEQMMKNSSPEDRKKGMEAWMGWAKGLGSSMIELGTPLGHNKKVTPEGVSDTKNDVWVIKGLPIGIDNTVTVFNRWGNKVYEKINYDNSWNGFPNVGGTLGNEKLPHGTYYYIIEFKTGDIKPLNGFVIIQY